MGFEEEKRKRKGEEERWKGKGRGRKRKGGKEGVETAKESFSAWWWYEVITERV